MFDKIKNFVKENKVCQFVIEHKSEIQVGVMIALTAANVYLLGKCSGTSVNINIDNPNGIAIEGLD